MTMISGNVYPDAETYYGDAYVSHNIFRSLRTDSSTIESNAQNMIIASENEIRSKNGIMLESYVWVEEKTYMGVPILEWTVDMYYFMPQTLAIQIPIIVGYILFTAAFGLVIWQVGESGRKIGYGYPPVIDPETGQIVKNPNVSMAEVANKAMTYAGPLLLGYGALMLYQTYQKTKVGGYNGIP